MHCRKEWMRLYAVTDRTWLDDKTLAEQVEAAILGGATIVQLREKQLADALMLEQARQLLPICRKHHVPLILNDRADIVVESQADGVHIGLSDMEITKARQLLGPDKLIGASAHSVEEALRAQAAGADYLGAGSVFATSTKSDVGRLPLEILRSICAAVSIPVVAIGGISAENLLELAHTGIAGVAVVSAIFAQPDVATATSRLRHLTEQL